MRDLALLGMLIGATIVAAVAPGLATGVTCGVVSLLAALLFVRPSTVVGGPADDWGTTLGYRWFRVGDQVLFPKDAPWPPEATEAPWDVRIDGLVGDVPPRDPGLPRASWALGAALFFGLMSMALGTAVGSAIWGYADGYVVLGLATMLAVQVIGSVTLRRMTVALGALPKTHVELQGRVLRVEDTSLVIGPETVITHEDGVLTVTSGEQIVVVRGRASWLLALADVLRGIVADTPAATVPQALRNLQRQ
ncbi:MAG: hypothetical protein KC656_06440 [Myxococcales bacterium]|nr:hypothetical protein [Myxococcales bacterium]